MYRYLLFVMLPLYLSANICEPIMCFDSQGNCIKITLQELNEIVFIEAALFTKDLGWLKPQVISDPARTVISKPLYKSNDQGMLTVVWQSLDLENTVYLEAAIYSEAKGWETTAILSESLESLTPGVYAIYLDKTGNPFVTWQSSSHSSSTLYLRTSYFANPGWTTPIAIPLP